MEILQYYFRIPLVFGKLERGGEGGKRDKREKCPYKTENVTLKENTEGSMKKKTQSNLVKMLTVTRRSSNTLKAIKVKPLN